MRLSRRTPVLAWLGEMTRLAHALMQGIATSLGLEPDYFFDRYTRDPLILFRVFNYPGVSNRAPSSDRWGVGEHTDYGVLTAGTVLTLVPVWIVYTVLQKRMQQALVSGAVKM